MMGEGQSHLSLALLHAFEEYPMYRGVGGPNFISIRLARLSYGALRQ